MASLLDIIIPKEKKFFELLQKQVAILQDCALKFNQQIQSKHTSLKDFEKLDEYIDKENLKSDKLVQEINISIHDTFITPIDRDEIQNLTMLLDAAINSIQELTAKLTYISFSTFDSNFLQGSQLLYDCIINIKEIFNNPIHFKTNKVNIDNIRKMIRQAGKTSHKSMRKVFSTENAVEIIKSREIYETLGETFKKINNIINSFEIILINHS